jgi:hypothetical protein
MFRHGFAGRDNARNDEQGSQSGECPEDNNERGGHNYREASAVPRKN